MFLMGLPSCFWHVSTVLSFTACDGAITPEVLRRINWTMVSAIPSSWVPLSESTIFTAGGKKNLRRSLASSTRVLGRERRLPVAHTSNIDVDEVGAPVVSHS